MEKPEKRARRRDRRIADANGERAQSGRWWWWEMITAGVYDTSLQNPGRSGRTEGRWEMSAGRSTSKHNKKKERIILLNKQNDREILEKQQNTAEWRDNTHRKHNILDTTRRRGEINWAVLSRRLDGALLLKQ